MVTSLLALRFELEYIARNCQDFMLKERLLLKLAALDEKIKERSVFNKEPRRRPQAMEEL